MPLQTLLEAIMLLCFGVAWPVANLRMLRSRRADGKGMAFTVIILIGYAVGATAKWTTVGPGQQIPGLFWLYTLNGASVLLNLLLQWHFSRRFARAAARAPAPASGAAARRHGVGSTPGGRARRAG